MSQTGSSLHFRKHCNTLGHLTWQLSCTFTPLAASVRAQTSWILMAGRAAAAARLHVPPAGAEEQLQQLVFRSCSKTLQQGRRLMTQRDSFPTQGQFSGSLEPGNCLLHTVANINKPAKLCTCRLYLPLFIYNVHCCATPLANCFVLLSLYVKSGLKVLICAHTTLASEDRSLNYLPNMLKHHTVSMCLQELPLCFIRGEVVRTSDSHHK